MLNLQLDEKMLLVADKLDLQPNELTIEEIRNEIDFWLSYYDGFHNLPETRMNRVIDLHEQIAKKALEEPVEEKVVDEILELKRENALARINYMRKKYASGHSNGSGSASVKLKK